ncbi:killer cell lectin-like receptor subfamily B member 1 [Echinops telfairi]|uniref:Killer cell lectin-like receptor subfamily B member 1 n=1 Tax=Echinops telfairi TaxID=9371 RepID=A0ABM0J8Y6_ECHTE|nr:killer cell lectin-like receptor subfamily B member 1 [Echinops telfairi]
MDNQVTYADLNLSRESAPVSSSPPSLLRDVCQGPRWHHWALKLGCAGILLFALAVIGLSVAVIFLSRNLSAEKCNVDTPEEHRTQTTERPSPVECPILWHQVHEKCLFLFDTQHYWNDSLADCYQRDSSLLLIQDEVELRLIQHLIQAEGILYWIGLNFTLPEKNWKWMNGSFLNSDVLQITGDHDKNSCALLSNKKIVSEVCSSENKWICQKELKPVRTT